jgi:hypothetical protein
MKINKIKFPVRLDGNSVWQIFRAKVDENSASRRFFRSGRMGRFGTQPIEITLDDFSATAKNKASLQRRFAARNGLRRAEVKLRQKSCFRTMGI